MVIYLDYNATTPLDEAACASLVDGYRQFPGHPDSRDHRGGWEAAQALEDVRSRMLDMLGSCGAHLSFTSGATEGLAGVLRGFVTSGACRDEGISIVTCATEHAAVLEPCRWLAARTGVSLVVLPVDREGCLDIQQLQDALLRAQRDRRRVLVALMAANNETGVLHPLQDIARLVQAADAYWLCDMSQMVGKMPVDLATLGADFVVMSAHKTHGPKGCGALWVSPRAQELRRSGHFDPWPLGGGQESGWRAGTVNLPGVRAFAMALQNTVAQLPGSEIRLRALRDRFESAMLSRCPGTRVNGAAAPRLPNTSNLLISGIDARALVRTQDAVAVSTRSACSSGRQSASHVLSAMGLSPAQAASCIRVSSGPPTTAAEMDRAADVLVNAVARWRAGQGAA